MEMTSFWKFWQKAPVVGPLDGQLRLRLGTERDLSDQAMNALRMVTRPGLYVERKVTLFRVIDPTAVARAGVTLHSFGDLDNHRALQLHDGHIERDGRIVLNRQHVTADGSAL